VHGNPLKYVDPSGMIANVLTDVFTDLNIDMWGFGKSEIENALGSAAESTLRGETSKGLLAEIFDLFLLWTLFEASRDAMNSGLAYSAARWQQEESEARAEWVHGQIQLNVARQAQRRAAAAVRMPFTVIHSTHGWVTYIDINGDVRVVTVDEFNEQFGRHVTIGGGYFDPFDPCAGAFTSPDKYVAETANLIESLFPGRVVGINRVVYRADGNPLTDFDIELDTMVIQVKSGGASGLLDQLNRTTQGTHKKAIGYTPDRNTSSAVVSGARAHGYEVFTDLKDLLNFIANN